MAGKKAVGGSVVLSPQEEGAIDAAMTALHMFKQSMQALRLSLDQADKQNPEVRAIFQDRLVQEELDDFARQMSLWKDIGTREYQG